MSAADTATGLTISGALERLTGDLRGLHEDLQSELGGKDIRCFQAPDTLTQAYSDAQAAQQALAEQGGGKKRKLLDETAEAAKKWAFGPGESLVNPDVAPFLAYNEEYFRHITPEDVANLVPEGATRPEDDPDFRIPALGRYYVLGEPRFDPRIVTRTTPDGNTTPSLLPLYLALFISLFSSSVSPTSFFLHLIKIFALGF